jgi:hypothetical protein
MILDYDRHRAFWVLQILRHPFFAERENSLFMTAVINILFAAKKLFSSSILFHGLPVKMDPVFFTLILKVSVNFARLCLIAILLQLDDGKLVVLDFGWIPISSWKKGYYMKAKINRV